MSNKYTIVLDIGARYGIHPTWKKIESNLDFKFLLFEPDPGEYKRLKKKYLKRKNLNIFNIALGDKVQKNKLYISQHKALSSIYTRKNNNPLLKNSKNNKVIKSITIEEQTLDKFCEKKKIKPHFLKLDVEGYEYNILKGGKKSLNNLMGIRSEVSFEKIFNSKDEGDFSQIHELLLKNDFILLNLDYNGQGFHFSKFVSQNQKYGILQTTDAVWIKNPNKIDLYYNSEESLLRISLFLFLNNAPDLAIYFLNIFSKKKKKKLYKNKLFLEVVKHCATHFQSLKHSPGINQKEIKKIFKKFFGINYPENEKFNESIFYNP